MKIRAFCSRTTFEKSSDSVAENVNQCSRDNFFCVERPNVISKIYFNIYKIHNCILRQIFANERLWACRSLKRNIDTLLAHSFVWNWLAHHHIHLLQGPFNWQGPVKRVDDVKFEKIIKTKDYLDYPLPRLISLKYLKWESLLSNSHFLIGQKI